MENVTTNSSQATPPHIEPAVSPVPSEHTSNKQSSPRMSLVAMLFASIAILIGAFFYKGYTGAAVDNQNTAISQNPAVTNQPSSPEEVSAASSVSSGDSQLDQQSKAIDDSLGKLGADISNTNKGLQDQAVDLSQ